MKNYYKALSFEVIAKFFSRSFAVFRYVLLLYIFGVGESLDSFFLAFSLVGILLAPSVFVEIVFVSKILKNIHDEDLYLWLRSLFIIVLPIGVLFVSITGIVFNVSVFQHVLVLSIWSVINLTNLYIVTIARLKQRYKLVSAYFFINPALILVFVLFFIYFLEVTSPLIISFSVFFAELFLFLLLSLKVDSRVVLFVKKFDFSWVFEPKAVVAFFVLVTVYSIEIVDKQFASLVGEGGVTLLTYGALGPLMLRQALDVKTLFLVTLSSNVSWKQDQELLRKTQKRIFKISLPLLITGLLLMILIGETIMGLLFEVNGKAFKEIFWIFFIYSILLPAYLSWDFHYRIFFNKKKYSFILGLILIGFILNILGNVVFVFIFDLEIVGIAISTCIVFVFYALVCEKKLEKQLVEEKLLSR